MVHETVAAPVRAAQGRDARACDRGDLAEQWIGALLFPAQAKRLLVSVPVVVDQLGPVPMSLSLVVVRVGGQLCWFGVGQVGQVNALPNLKHRVEFGWIMVKMGQTVLTLIS